MEENNVTLLKSILRNQNILSAADERDNQKLVLETDLYKPTQGVLSNSVFFGLHDHQNDEEEVKCLFMKISKAVDNLESYTLSTFFNDAYFYSKIVPFFQTFGDPSSFLPNYLGSSLNMVGSTEKCAIVAENLQTAGYQHISPKSRWDYPHLALVLEKFGELHAFSYKAKTLDRKRFYSLVTNLTKNIESTAVMNIDVVVKKSLIDVLENIRQDKQFIEYNASIIRRLEYVIEKDNMLIEFQKQLTVDPDTNENLVLCHGDSNPLNFMFKYENGKPTNVKFFDFANCRLASPTLDLLYLLYCTTDEKMRLEHWDDLIDLYYSALSKAFTDNVIPAKSSIINDFPSQALWSGLIGISWAPYLMAIDEMGENVPQNMPLEEIDKISKSKTGERLIIFQDMVKRGFI